MSVSVRLSSLSAGLWSSGANLWTESRPAPVVVPLSECWPAGGTVVHADAGAPCWTLQVHTQAALGRWER